MRGKVRREVEAAVLKKALGYVAEETEEEYAVKDGVPELIRRKVKARDVPPDIAAARLLLSAPQGEKKRETEAAELIKLKKRLIKDWEEKYGDGKDGR